MASLANKIARIESLRAARQHSFDLNMSEARRYVATGNVTGAMAALRNAHECHKAMQTINLVLSILK